MYATNPGLFKPGESGRNRKRGKPVGRPRKDGLPPIQKGQVEVILSGLPVPAPAAGHPSAPTETVTPAFQVQEADTIKDAVETNGLALLQDAYKRAARAPSSGDPFDRAVYLTLLGKAHPMAQMDGKEKVIPGAAKKKLRLLNQLLAEQEAAQDATFSPVPPSDGDVVGAGAPGEAGGEA